MKPEDLRKFVEHLRSIRSGNESFDVANIGWTSAVNREKER
jgi:hypothetical protein